MEPVTKTKDSDSTWQFNYRLVTKGRYRAQKQRRKLITVTKASLTAPLKKNNQHSVAKHRTRASPNSPTRLTPSTTPHSQCIYIQNYVKLSHPHNNG